MKTKLLQFGGVSETGEPLVQSIFSTSGASHKVKLASQQLDPKVAKFIQTIEPCDDKLYVLVNAMGAGEVYGSNINGDYFEEDQLNPVADVMTGVGVYPATYGYRTFYDAGIYRHHRNKDKTKSYGQVVFATFNPRMKRVELIVCIDRAKATEMGHDDLVASLDRGENPAVSMGCRVPYDVCSICGNESKTRRDYCAHAKQQMNQILGDGRKVFVYNPRPRFFDLSFVVIGADRTGFAMKKVASAAGDKPELSADLAHAMGMTASDSLVSMVESRLKKQALADKRAELLKHVPGAARKLSVEMEQHLPPMMPFGLIKRLCDSGGALSKILGTLRGAAVPVRRPEYQTIVLIKARRPELAESLYKAGSVFRGTSDLDTSVPIGDYDSGLAEQFSDVMRAQSVLGISPHSVNGLDKRAFVEVQRNTPLLEKIAAAYNGFVIDYLGSVEESVDSAARVSPELFTAMRFGAALEDEVLGLRKKAGAPAALLGALPLAFLYGAHVRGLRDSGQPVGPVDKFVEQHPVLATSIMVGLANFGSKLSGQREIGQLLTDAVSALR